MPNPLSPTDRVRPGLFRHPAFIASMFIFIFAMVWSLLRVDMGLWFDEGCSVIFAGGSLGEIFYNIIHGEANMALYYVLLHFWMNLSASETALRLFSAAFAFGSLIACHKLALKLFDRNTAGICVLLLGSNAFFLYYALEIRAYSLFAFLCLLAVLAYLRSFHGSRPGFYLFLALSCAAAYTHLFGLFMFASLMAFSLVYRSYSGWTLPRIFLAGAIFGAVCTPLMLFSFFGNTYTYWIPTPDLASVYHLLATFIGTDYRGTIFAVLLAALGFALAAFIHLRSNRDSGLGKYRPSPAFALCLSLVFIPIGLIFILSQFRSAFWPRYFIFVLPFFLLLLAVSINRLPWKVVRLGLLAGLIFLNLWPVLAMSQRRPEDFKGAAEYLFANYEPGDGVLFFPKFAAYPVAYYADRAGAKLDFISGPARARDIFATDQSVERDLAAALGKYRRIWLITSHIDSEGKRSTEKRIRESLQGNPAYQVGKDARFREVNVKIFGP